MTERKLCRRCGNEIPAERLEVFPNATRCVDCQGKAEDRGNVEVDLSRVYAAGLADVSIGAGELELQIA